MNFFLFQIYPYIALTVLAVGSISRYETDPFTWKSSSSQLLRRKQLILGSVLFHVGVLIVFFGHLVGLLTPIWVFDMLGVGHTFKQILAILVGGVAGIVALIGGVMLLHRRLTDPRILASSSVVDIGILALLLIQLVLGIGTIFVSLRHLEGGEMVRFMTWSQAIFTFRGDAWELAADASWIFKLHIFLGLTIFLLFPFTRLVHMLSAPVRYLWRPGYQIVRSRHGLAAPTRVVAKANPSSPPEAGKTTAATIGARPRPAE